MTITWPILTSLIPAGVTLVFWVIGGILWKTVSRGLGIIIIGIGLVFLLVFGPMLFMDKVELNDRQIRQTTGFWFDQTVKGFAFDDLKHVLIGTELDRQNRVKEVWFAEYRSGKIIKVDPGDLWESNGKQIIEYMENKGVVVVRE